MAIRDGRVVGFVPAEIMGRSLFGHCAWVAHPRHAAAAYLASTAVLEEMRGQGIGAALVAGILSLAAEEGDRSAVTNWRMTNLSASSSGRRKTSNLSITGCTAHWQAVEHAALPRRRVWRAQSHAERLGFLGRGPSDRSLAPGWLRRRVLRSVVTLASRTSSPTVAQSNYIRSSRFRPDGLQYTR